MDQQEAAYARKGKKGKKVRRKEQQTKDGSSRYGGTFHKGYEEDARHDEWS